MTETRKCLGVTLATILVALASTALAAEQPSRILITNVNVYDGTVNLASSDRGSAHRSSTSEFVRHT